MRRSLSRAGELLMTDRRGKEIDHDHAGQSQSDTDQGRNIQRLLENKLANDCYENKTRTTPEGVNNRYGHCFNNKDNIQKDSP